MYLFYAPDNKGVFMDWKINGSHWIRGCLAGIMLLVMICRADASSTGIFANRQDYTVGQNPSSITAGDLNSDGYPDLVTTNDNGNTISVLMNRKDMRFSSAVSYETGERPLFSRFSDLDNDGIADICVCNADEDSISVFSGDGTGVFALKQKSPAGDCTSFVFMDLDEDGFLDIVSNSWYNDRVVLLYGNGAGGFQSGGHHAAGNAPDAVAEADLNQDGIADIAVSNFYSANISVFFGHEEGGFSSAIFFPTGKEPQHLVVEDMNGDGLPDMMTPNSEDRTISILLGKGEGFFDNPVFYPVDELPVYLATGDIDGGGQMDIIAVNSGSNTVSILFGKGDGTFHTKRTLDTGNNPRAAQLTDTDLDGDPDLVVANRNSNSISVFENIFDSFPATFFLSASPVYGAAPLITTITCTSLGEQDGVFEYTMEFGDGSPSETNTTGVFPHTYEQPDTYYANCMIKTQEGTTETESISIEVVRASAGDILGNISIGLPEKVTETRGILEDAGVISLSQAFEDEISVFLSASDNSRIILPESVIIPEGYKVLYFDIEMVDDEIQNTAASITVTAVSENLNPGTASLIIADDEGIDDSKEQSCPAGAGSDCNCDCDECFIGTAAKGAGIQKPLLWLFPALLFTAILMMKKNHPNFLNQMIHIHKYWQIHENTVAQPAL